MSEKKDTRVITINTKILSSAFTAEEMQFIDEYLNHYNHIKFIKHGSSGRYYCKEKNGQEQKLFY